jgi:hypothetical protein
VVTGPGADDENARPSGQAGDGQSRWRFTEESLQRIRLRLNGRFEKRAGLCQAASSQALRNW